jgi:hypothetical protein
MGHRAQRRAMRVLDLFSGLNGWSETFEQHGHEVYRIDIDQRFDADAYLDINDIEAVMEAVPWKPDIILASPPCNSFTVMTIGRNWYHDGRPKTLTAEKGLMNVTSVYKLVALMRPKWWVMENPRAKLRALDITRGLPRKTITQCQYGYDRMKATDLWGVWPEGLDLKPPCKNGDSCHQRAPRGSTNATQGGLAGVDSAKIPYELADAFRVAFEEAWIKEGFWDV